MILPMVIWFYSAAARAPSMYFRPMLSVILGSFWVVPGRILQPALVLLPGSSLRWLMMVPMVIWFYSAAAQVLFMYLRSIHSAILGSFWVVPGRISQQAAALPHGLAHPRLMMLLMVTSSCSGADSVMSVLVIPGSLLRVSGRILLQHRVLLLALSPLWPTMLPMATRSFLVV